MDKTKLIAIIEVLVAALSYGISAPFQLILMEHMSPVLIAGFLYLGSGLCVLLYKGVLVLTHKQNEAGLSRKDIKWLAGTIIAGGVLAPIIVNMGIKYTPITTASILLNFELVATTLIAFLVFREPISKNIAFAVTLITIASIVMSYTGGGLGFSLGAFGIIFGTFLWGVDNNFTRNISGKDPLTIVIYKGIIGGLITCAVVFLFISRDIPDFKYIILTMLLGGFSYGLSIAFYILGMRVLGSARGGAFFGTAPFMGAAISFIIWPEIPSMQFIIGLILMLAGTVLVFQEKHSHMHVHEYMVHEHLHSHNDGHHLHHHEGGDDIIHSHMHVHERMEHDHPHTPDIHHRHTH